MEWCGVYGLSMGWKERTTEEVRKKIEQMIGSNFSVDTFEKDNEKLASEIEDFQVQVELLVSSVAGKDLTHPLANTEKVEPRKKLEAYVKSHIPNSIMTRDSEALAQGI